MTIIWILCWIASCVFFDRRGYNRGLHRAERNASRLLDDMRRREEDQFEHPRRSSPLHRVK